MKDVSIYIFADPMKVMYYIGNKWGFGDRVNLTDLCDLTFQNNEDLTFILLMSKLKNSA